MSVEKRNDCVGCKPCLNCGLNHAYYVRNCDYCGDFLGEGGYRGFSWEGQDWCEDCLRTAMVMKHFFPDCRPDEMKIREFFSEDEEWLNEYGAFKPSMFGDEDVDDIAEFCGEDFGFIEEDY